MQSRNLSRISIAGASLLIAGFAWHYTHANPEAVATAWSSAPTLTPAPEVSSRKPVTPRPSDSTGLLPSSRPSIDTTPRTVPAGSQRVEPVVLDRMVEPPSVDEFVDDEAYAEYLETRQAMLGPEEHASEEAMLELEMALRLGALEGTEDISTAQVWSDVLQDVWVDGGGSLVDVSCVPSVCRISAPVEDDIERQQLIDDITWAAHEERVSGIQTDLLPDGSQRVTIYLTRDEHRSGQPGGG